MLADVRYQIPEPTSALQPLRPDNGWCKDRKIDQCDRSASLESIPHVNGHLVYEKCQCSAVGSLLNRVGHTLDIHIEKKKVQPLSYIIHKKSSSCEL